MIPKIIHYCWFGPRELSALNKACIESWQRFLSDYQIILWNEGNAPDHPYVKLALKYKKYAFAADFTRFYALNKFGGIYFDTDVEVIQNFDNLLLNEFFAAYEDSRNVNINGAILGATAGNQIALEMLKKYESNQEFINIPVLINEVISEIDNKNVHKIFPNYYFYPYNPFDEHQTIKQLLYRDIQLETYAIHHWEYSWKPSLKEKVYSRLRKMLKL